MCPTRPGLRENDITFCCYGQPSKDCSRWECCLAFVTSTFRDILKKTWITTNRLSIWKSDFISPVPISLHVCRRSTAFWLTYKQTERSFLGRVMKGSTGESPWQLSDPVQSLHLCTQPSQWVISQALVVISQALVMPAARWQIDTG